MSLAEFVSTTLNRTARRPAPVALPTLPEIEPGQLWLVEAPVNGAPPAPARHALDGANVVIYDRVLAEPLSRALPLGTYAEPASPADGIDDASTARCVRFARDGWSVARLLPSRLAQRERASQVRRLVDALAAARMPGELGVQVFAETADGIYEKEAARLDRLVALVATYPRDARLTIVIGALGSAARPHAVAGNGLAG